MVTREGETSQKHWTPQQHQNRHNHILKLGQRIPEINSVLLTAVHFSTRTRLTLPSSIYSFSLIIKIDFFFKQDLNTTCHNYQWLCQQVKHCSPHSVCRAAATNLPIINFERWRQDLVHGVTSVFRPAGYRAVKEAKENLQSSLLERGHLLSGTAFDPLQIPSIQSFHLHWFNHFRDSSVLVQGQANSGS